MPEMAVGFARFDFEVADRGLQAGVPVDQALVAINQAALVERHENVRDRFREMFVHRELFTRPVHRTAEAA